MCIANDSLTPVPYQLVVSMPYFHNHLSRAQVDAVCVWLWKVNIENFDLLFLTHCSFWWFCILFCWHHRVATARSYFLACSTPTWFIVILVCEHDNDLECWTWWVKTVMRSGGYSSRLIHHVFIHSSES